MIFFRAIRSPSARPKSTQKLRITFNVYIFGTRMGPEKLSLVHADEDNFLGLKLGHIHADPRS